MPGNQENISNNDEVVIVEPVVEPTKPVALTVEELAQAQLKPIKAKLDKAYEIRDEALRRVAEYEAKERADELKRLEEAGKHQEAAEIRLSEERAKREAAEKLNLELTRDMAVRNALSSHSFRSEKATEMAYREIVGQLVQNAAGQWVHTTGAQIKDFVKAFADHEDNSFLIRPKPSSGSGSTAVKSPTPSNAPKSLFAMSQEEVLNLAREGKLRKGN